MPGQHRNRTSYRDPDRPRGQRLSAVERAQILTLFHTAKWSKRAIAKELRLSEATVRLCIAQGIITPPSQLGRRPNLTTQKRKRLIARATLNAYHRRLPYEEIAVLEGISACRRSLVKAFQKEQYHRRVATEKPLLTESHKQKRIAWAQRHKDWNFDMWQRVDWTDEAIFRSGLNGTIYVTRTAEEKYTESCCIPKFKQKGGIMVHGAISGHSKGPLVVFDAGTKVTALVYSMNVLPSIYQHIREMERNLGFMRGILMADNASVHTAKFTKAYYAYYGFIKMEWPPNSPDLNPIENVWRLLKYRVGKRFPKTLAEIEQYVTEEWAKLELHDFLKYIEEMPARCAAVIAANGGHTKW